MRPWRKFSQELLSSARVRSLSDAGYRLWTMLLIAQDDDAVFPWGDEAHLAMLLAGTTQWTVDDRERLAEELEKAGLIIRKDGFVYLYRGADFNGHLRKDNNPFYYRKPEQRELEVNLRFTGGQPKVCTEKRRGEKKRKDKTREEKNSSTSSEIHKAIRPKNGVTDGTTELQPLTDVPDSIITQRSNPAPRVG